MAKRLQFRRVLWLALLLGLAFAGLGYRLVDLQVLRHAELSALAQQNTQREYLLEPRRGDIIDCKGNLLATTIVTKGICADPVLIAGHQVEVARALAPLLQTNEAVLVQLLTPRVRRSPEGVATTNAYVCLKHKVPAETWDKIRSAMTNLLVAADEKRLSRAERATLRNLREKAVFARDEQMRVYPNQTLAAQVLGFTGNEQTNIDGFPVSEIAGLEGIEKSFNSKLAGIRGWRVTETDRQRRELVSLREQDIESRDGLNVVLSIDSVLQNIVELALADAMKTWTPISACGIIVRPRTGEILAMATLPNFDPNHPGSATADDRRNRVIADVAEPGSTFKIVVVSGALNDGVVTLSETFDCEHGHWFYGGRPLRDHESFGTLSVENIITKSSNIGAAKIGVKLGPERLYDYILAYGFGSPTGVPLPGEVPGIVHPVSRWHKVSIAQIPMGQGVAVTRLQMLMAMCAIANGGVLMQPMLVERLEDSSHHVLANYSPVAVRRIISQATDRQMVEALKTVVSPAGTAAKAALDHYTVAGKTGTAQKVENRTYVDKFFSSFIGFFPADNPELCISITMDEPKPNHFGGAVCGPVFKKIAEQAANYLSIRPEDGTAPALPASLAGAPGSERRASLTRSQ